MTVIDPRATPELPASTSQEPRRHRMQASPTTTPGIRFCMVCGCWLPPGRGTWEPVYHNALVEQRPAGLESKPGTPPRNNPR